MLGIILIYFIGKYFHDLAKEFNKNKWMYAILAVVVFYAAQMVVGFILGLLFPEWFEMMDTGTELALNLAGLPIGIGAVYVFYILTKKKWEKEKEQNSPNIEDIGSF